jgi:hypothetical protein
MAHDIYNMAHGLHDGANDHWVFCFLCTPKLNCMHIVTLVQSCTNQILHKPIFFFWLSCWCGIYVTHVLIICKIKSSIGFCTSLFWKDYKWRLVLGLNEDTNLEA